MKGRKLWVFLAVAALLVGLLTGCGADSGYSENKTAVGGMQAPDTKYEGELSKSEEGTQTVAPANQKLIRTVRMRAETDAMDALLSNLDKRIAELGGYVESRNVYTGGSASGTERNAELTVRIPAEHLDAFVDKISQSANITSINETAEDITLSYIATESRIKALETEQERLLELLAEAQSMEDLLTIEARLTDVRTELEQVNSVLRRYDNQVNYGTIHLTVRQVQEYTDVKEAPTGFFERAWAALCGTCQRFGNFLQELGILLFAMLPVIIPGAGLLTWWILRRRKKKKKEQEK